MPDMPLTKSGVIRWLGRGDRNRADKEGLWWRKRQGRGGGVEYSFQLLPDGARGALLTKLRTEAEAAAPAPDGHAGLARDVAWVTFMRCSDAERGRAQRRLLAVRMVADRLVSGWTCEIAMRVVAQEFDVAVSTLYDWRKRVEGIGACDQVAHLIDLPGAGRASAECAPEAWEMFKADFLRLERPSYATCYRRLLRVAAQKGWAVPSCKTLQRRIEEMPLEVRTARREGEKALKAMYPAQERDRGVFHALQAVCADGHKMDVFVRWDDGSIGRPELIGFQDLYSGMILSWRLEKSENQEAVRLCIGDMVEQWGIPEQCYLDNGRAFASHWISGGSKTRFRFKQHGIDGVLKTLGIEPHFVTPYSGQSKPIERAWRDFADNISRDPRLAGAYTGAHTQAKPENYGSRAIGIDELMRVVSEGVIEHNERTGRDTKACGKRRSFRQAFDASYAVSMIRKVTTAQRQFWFLAAEALVVRKPSATLHLLGNRYWASELTQLMGTRVVARFDPAAMHQDLQVFTLDGRLVCSAACIEAAGFNDVAAAQEHSRQRRRWMRAVREQSEAERGMKLSEVAALMDATSPLPPSKPETKIVRLVTGAGAVREAAVDAVDEGLSETDRQFMRAVAMQQRAAPAPLRLIEGDPETDET